LASTWRERLEMNLRAAYARAWVRMVSANRKRLWVLVDVLVLAAPVLSYGLLYSFAGASSSLVGTLVVGVFMLPFWMNVVWNMASQFYWEKQVGNFEAYMVAPVSRVSILLGMAFGGLFNTILRSAFILVIGAAAFAPVFVMTNLIPAMLIFFLTMGALYSLGMLLCSLFMLYGREAWQTASLVQEPISFLSGVYFPIAFFPDALRAAITVIPLAIGLDAVRNLLVVGSSLQSVYWEVAVLGVFTVVFTVLALKSLRFMESLAKKEGRLTLRWQ
jgi:ABC-2 type transport system permease protein